MNAIGWERAILGSVLSDPAGMEHAEVLRPGDFTGAHKQIWAEIAVLHRRGALDTRALIEALRSVGVLETVGSSDVEIEGEEYISYLLNFRGDAVPEYVERCLENSTKRQLGMVAAAIRVDAYDDEVSAQDALDQAERRIVTLRRTGNVEGVSMVELMAALTGRMDGLLDGSIRPAWTPAIQPLRNIIQYAEAEDFMIIASRPGQGKSSIIRYELGTLAMSGTPALIINLENSEIEYARYLISMHTGIDSLKLKTPGRMSDEELGMVRSAMEDLQHIPLHIVSLGSPSATEVERIARQYVSKYNVGLIGIDYLQLIRNNRQSRVEDVSETSGTVRSIALRYRVPVIAAAQMSRNIIHRGVDAEPELADLRESGSLEQDATIVCFPHRVWQSPTPDQLRMFSENIDPDGFLYSQERAVPIRILVKKNRNGGVGQTGEILWVKYNNRFSPLEMEEEFL